jgi:hypothetical protein
VQQLTEERDVANTRLAVMSDDIQQLNRNTAELLRLRNEVSLSRGNPRALSPGNGAPSPVIGTGPTAGVITGNNPSQGPSPEEIEMGRALGVAVVRGDPGALEKVRELAEAEHKTFRTNSLASTFAPLWAAFDAISEAALAGNPLALDAVVQAAQIPELRGQATKCIGKLAGNGNDAALETLLNPDKYGLLLSGTVGALRPAAEGGNQQAIDALAAVTADQKHTALWMMAADGLGKAAETGNAVAIDALIGLSASTNISVRNSVVQGLRRAAANQNAKAAETLRSLGVQ